MAHRDRVLRDEVGVMRFDVMISNHDERKIYIHEVYADAAARMLKDALAAAE